MNWTEYEDVECVECGETDTVPVWENPRDYFLREPPDYVGCKNCHTMREL